MGWPIGKPGYRYSGWKWKALRARPCKHCGKEFWPIASSQQACSLLCRVLSRIDTNGPIPAHRPELGHCHVWLGAKHAFGHGWIGEVLPDRRLKIHLVHRLVYISLHGMPPMDKPNVCHHCDNPPCVRDEHLFVGDNADNAADRESKGRTAHGHAVGSTRRTDGTSRLTSGIVAEIVRRRIEGESSRSLAASFDLHYNTIQRIVRGAHWLQSIDYRLSIPPHRSDEG